MYSCPLLSKRKFACFQIEVLKEKYLLKLLGLLWPSTTWLIMNFLFSFQFPCCVINVRKVERIQIHVVHFSINFSDMSLLHVAFFRLCAAQLIHPMMNVPPVLLPVDWKSIRNKNTLNYQKQCWRLTTSDQETTDPEKLQNSRRQNVVFYSCEICRWCILGEAPFHHLTVHSVQCT